MEAFNAGLRQHHPILRAKPHVRRLFGFDWMFQRITNL